MNTLRFIKTNGFNGITAMDIGCHLGLIYLEKSEEEYLKEHNDVVYAVEEYCTLNNIDDKSKNDFLSEVNEYSLK